MKVDAKIDASGETFLDQAEVRKASRRLAPEVVRKLTKLDDGKAAWSVIKNITLALVGVVPALMDWNIWTVLWAIAVVPFAAHGFAILSHEAVHYRLFSNRSLNEIIGRSCGLVIGVSMCTYRVVHRLHHNHLYERDLDPDLALMAGYPRGKFYLFKKLLIDFTGITAGLMTGRQVVVRHRRVEVVFDVIVDLVGEQEPTDDRRGEVRAGGGQR